MTFSEMSRRQTDLFRGVSTIESAACWAAASRIVSLTSMPYQTSPVVGIPTASKQAVARSKTVEYDRSFPAVSSSPDGSSSRIYERVDGLSTALDIVESVELIVGDRGRTAQHAAGGAGK